MMIVYSLRISSKNLSGFVHKKIEKCVVSNLRSHVSHDDEEQDP